MMRRAVVEAGESDADADKRAGGGAAGATVDDAGEISVVGNVNTVAVATSAAGAEQKLKTLRPRHPVQMRDDVQQQLHTTTRQCVAAKTTAFSAAVHVGRKTLVAADVMSDDDDTTENDQVDVTMTGETPEISLSLQRVMEHERSVNRCMSELECISWEDSSNTVLDAMVHMLEVLNNVPMLQLPLDDAASSCITEQQMQLQREIQHEKMQIKRMLIENFSERGPKCDTVCRLLDH